MEIEGEESLSPSATWLT